MRKLLTGALVVAAIAASSLALAQQQKPAVTPASAPAWSAADLSALLDARIAALKTGLKLTAEQEKNWPPVEAALRDMAKQRADRFQALRTNAAMRDPIMLLRARADIMTASAASLKSLADASEPLYKSLDDSQKRRLLVLLVAGTRR